MSRKIEHPTVTAIKSPDQGTRYEHPAFAQIRASRVSSSGGVPLYGSDLLHQNFITITIGRSQLTRSLSRDWYFSNDGLIEVTLSEAQWASFVSSLNIGTGVPCTLTRHEGREVPGLPHRAQDHEFKNEVRKTMRAATAELDAALAELEVADTKTKRRAVFEKVRMARQHLVSNLPFVADQFDRHAETTIETARAEVAAYFQSIVTRAGLAALGQDAPVQLPAPEESA